MSQEQKQADVVADITVEHPESVQAAGQPDTLTGGEAQPADQADLKAQAAGRESGELPLLDHDTLQALQAELEQARGKAEENWKLYLGARAETENVRKRSERELENARKYALKEFIETLLPVKDSLELGIAAASDTVDVNKLREGTELTLKMLITLLEKVGVQEIDPLGARFNPDLHQAMAMQPSAQAEPNTILQVVQKGYLLKERLLRPALVIIAQAVQKQDSEAHS